MLESPAVEMMRIVLLFVALLRAGIGTRGALDEHVGKHLVRDDEAGVARKAAIVLVTRVAQKLFEVPADEFVETNSLGAAGRVSWSSSAMAWRRTAGRRNGGALGPGTFRGIPACSANAAPAARLGGTFGCSTASTRRT